jgi:type IV secretory pathway VirB10-like protein
MDSGFLAYLSWREMLVLIVVLLVLYILFAFLRISHLRSEAAPARELPPVVIRKTARAQAAAGKAEMPDEPEDDAAPAAPEKPSPAARKKQAFAWNEPPAKGADSRRIEVLEQDVAQLRREIGGLRAEVQTLREEQRREMNKVQAVQSTSPFYSDAMQLATQGREAADISVLCGISRAEAELVVALARNTGQTLDWQPSSGRARD